MDFSRRRGQRTASVTAIRTLHRTIQSVGAKGGVMTSTYHHELGPYGLLPTTNQPDQRWRNRVQQIGDPEHPMYDPNRSILVRYATTLHGLHEQVVEQKDQ